MINVLSIPKTFVVKITYVLIFTFLALISNSQSITRIDNLKDITKNESSRYLENKVQNSEWSEKSKTPLRFERNGRTYELKYINLNGTPQYLITNNATAAATISTQKLYPFGGLGLNLTGNGIIIREWDAGSALVTHQEFGGRVVAGDGALSDDHATHVAGTIMAAGIQAQAKGMAYEASLRSFDWNNDIGEMASEAVNGALISNHSYGLVRGWSDGTWHGDPEISTEEDYLFGFYDYWSSQFDNVAYNAPYYLICKAAGNDRGDSGDGYPSDGPYDCIEQYAIAKNILTVGAVNDIPSGYSQPSDVVMTTFSSWGPADDGRIKPDIVANGYGLYSASNSGNTKYVTKWGTSMATPSVTGSLALLQQHYYNLNGIYMRASTLKALAIHTADEAGDNLGPDYKFGWGLMNTASAAQMISEDLLTNVISEHALANGGTYTRQVTASGNEPLVVTIVWTDRPGIPVEASLDPLDPMLINDLDLKITTNSSTYYPWKLDRDNPESAATNNSKNYVDNVEKVFIGNPSQVLTYTITVDHDGPLVSGSQVFSLLVSGIVSSTAPIANFSASSINANVSEIVTLTDLSLSEPASWSWSISPSTFTYENSTSATSQNPQVNFYEAGNYTIGLTVTNAIGSDTEIKTNYINVTGCSGFSLPYYEGFESGIFPPSCWTTVDADGDGNNWMNISLSNSQEGSNAVYSESYINSFGSLTPDNWLITPGLNSTAESITIKFWVKPVDPLWLDDKFSVLISTASNDVSDFTEIYSQNTMAVGWNEINITSGDLAGNDFYIAFRHWDCSGIYQILLDNISIEEIGIPSNTSIVNQTIVNGETTCFNANDTITVAGNGTTVDFESGADVLLIAGKIIRFLPGFHAFEGSYMNASITTNNTFCDSYIVSSSNYNEPIASKSSQMQEAKNLKKVLSRKLDVNIFPNPNNGRFIVELNQFEEPVSIKVFDLLGATVFSKNIQVLEQFTVELPNVQQGVYLVQINNGQESIIRKIIIKH